MSEKQYIEREAAVNAIMGEPTDAHYPGWYAGKIAAIPAAPVMERTQEAAIDYLRNIGWLQEHDRILTETAPVREVVTCGECIFWNHPPSCEGLARCLTGESGVRYRTKYDFCSRGKRPDTRTEEGEAT